MLVDDSGGSDVSGRSGSGVRGCSSGVVVMVVLVVVLAVVLVVVVIMVAMVMVGR